MEYDIIVSSHFKERLIKIEYFIYISLHCKVGELGLQK